MGSDSIHRLDTDALAEVEVRDERAPRARKRMHLLAGVAIAVVVALIAWALHARSQRNDARAALADLRQEKRDLEDALALHRASKTQLDNELTTCVEERKVEREVVARTELNLQMCQTARDGLQDQSDQVAARMAELDQLTGRFREMVDTGDLSVKIRRGQMVVELPSAVLFPSGQAELSERGAATLNNVAKVLRTLPGRKFTVAGHTDSVPLKNAAFANNWELSSARAVRVTLQLIEAGVKPANLIAAGYGPYAPLASNRTARGKQQNRRIEIILEPDLGKLPDEVLDD